MVQLIIIVVIKIVVNINLRWATSEKRATQQSWVGSDVPSHSPCCDPAWHVSVGPPRAAKTQHQLFMTHARQQHRYRPDSRTSLHLTPTHFIDLPFILPFISHCSPFSLCSHLSSFFCSHLLLLSLFCIHSSFPLLLLVWLLFHYCALSIKWFHCDHQKKNNWGDHSNQ